MARHHVHRSALFALIALALVASAGVAAAATPSIVWQRAGVTSAAFSSDGNIVFLTTSTGFDQVRATDGALISRLTLPTASQGYTRSAFSPDKQLAALSFHSGGADRIE